MSTVQRKWLKYNKFLKVGDWHLHTNYTDGNSSVEQILIQAEANGLQFVVFSEHVRRELTYDYLKFKEEVYRFGSKSKLSFAVGAEVKVLDNLGNLDISEAVLDEADIILFSFHQHNFITKYDYIKAIKKATDNPIVDIWAHPTSYHNEMNFEITTDEWEEIIGHLIKNNVCYEINKRYPLPSDTEMKALSKFTNLVKTFGSDAHEAHTILTLNDIARLTSLLDT